MSDARPHTQPPPRPRPFELVLLVFGLALITRYAWVMDDAFIYARYADNAVLMKLGLVYNAGEYVEGFSSPLWMVWILLWRALGLSYWAMFMASAYLFFVLMWWVLVRLDLELSPTRERINVPLAFLALSYPVTSWFSSGMETSLIMACAAGYALYLVDPRSRLAGILVAIAPLVRPELAAPFVIAVAYAWSRTRRVPTLVLALAGGLGLAWLGFRVYYYADLLPNTFYLKHDSDRAQGLHYLVNAFAPYYLELILVGVALLSWWGVRFGGPAERAKLGPRMMMWVTGLPVVFYVVHIGGDAIHFRYLASPFVLALSSSSGLVEAWWSARERKLPFARWATAFAGLVAAISFSLQPPQREVHAIVAAGDPHKVHEISDAGRHRRRDYLREAATVDPHREAKLAVGRDPGSFEYVDFEISGLCAQAYVKWDHRVTHTYGLTDPFLARLEAPAMPGDRPGHKLGVTMRAVDVMRITKLGEGPRRGMMRDAIEGGYGADWVRDNIEIIEVIERKAFNEHELGENLRLAFRFPGPIVADR
jgi:hypothetical protein